MREIDVRNSSKLRMVCTRGRCWNLRTRMTGLYGYLMKVRARCRTVIWGRHEQGRDSSQNGASEKTLVSVKTSLLGHAWRERKICAEDEKNYNQLIINGLSVAGCMERERKICAEDEKNYNQLIIKWVIGCRLHQVYGGIEPNWGMKMIIFSHFCILECMVYWRSLHIKHFSFRCKVISKHFFPYYEIWLISKQYFSIAIQ